MAVVVGEALLVVADTVGVGCCEAGCELCLALVGVGLALWLVFLPVLPLLLPLG